MKKTSEKFKNNYSTTKNLKNPTFIDIKSVIIKHLKTSHKVSKARRQAEKVSQITDTGKFYSRLYSETQKLKHFEMKKKVKNEMIPYL